MILNDYNQIIREHFDLSDTRTRRAIIAFNEDSKEDQLLAALASSLYDKIVEKVDQIDFGTIPKSRGDITKVEGFENTVECLNIIRKMVVEYKDNTSQVDTVLTAIENVKQAKSLFMRCFSLNIAFGITLYNLIVLAIEQSVSFFISVTIQYIKDPATQTFELSLDRAAYNNSKDNLLYQQLITFNKSYASGEIESILRQAISKGGKIGEAADIILKKDDTIAISSDGEDDMDLASGEVPAAGSECPPSDDECEPSPTMPINGCGDVPEDQPVEEGTLNSIASGIKFIITVPFQLVKWTIKVIIPMMRNLTYFFISSIVSFSDALYIQAQLIEMNAYELQYSSNSELDDAKKKKVVEKQLKIAAKLKKIASKFAINDKKAKKEAEQMVADEAKKNKIDDIPVENPGDLF